MRWKFIIAGLLVITGVLAFFLLRENSSTRTLGDGSTLVLSSVRVGRTNVHTRGTFLSKTIGRFTPTNGFAFAGYKLQRPTKLILHGPDGCEILTAQFELFPRSARADDFLKPGFRPTFRVLISGADNFSHAHELSGLLMAARVR